ncbi:MAG: class I SAM-dependent methyltransferase [Isosphaeraceae bacterium]|nr:class I SAM-dependent methyltransferase [Isosphaeraceae bacterium]
MTVGRRTVRPDQGRLRRVGDTVAIAGDYQYRALTEGPRVQRFWHDTKRWLVQRYLAPGPNDRVLDVGCGSGVVAASLADTPVRECVAVDGNPEAIAFATARFQRPNLRFVQGLVDELDFADGSFDACCCLELIEHIHVEQGRELLATLARLLRPGGRLLITTPNVHSVWPLLEWTLDRLGLVPRLADEQHVAFYTHSRLEALWRRGPWSPLHRHTCCTIAPWAALASWPLAGAIREVEGGMPCGTLLVHVLQKRDGSRDTAPV